MTSPHRSRWTRFRYAYAPALTISALWLLPMVASGGLALFGRYWPFSITMVFGSFVAGATSLGGGAVAFPAFTKLLQVPPATAAVFGLAIQTIGMGSASLVIVRRRIPIARRALLCSSLGGWVGITIGIFLVAPWLEPDTSKILFTLLISGFGLALLVDNLGTHSRQRKQRIARFGTSDALVLGAAGMVGGIFSGLVGTGLDVVVFALLVMLYDLDEKVATPTSVILMAINSAVGFAYHGLVTGAFSGEVVNYWLVCVPVVAFGAPTGAMVCARASRRAVVGFLLLLIALEFASTLLLVPFTPVTRLLTPLVLGGSLLACLLLGRLRRRRAAAHSSGV